MKAFRLLGQAIFVSATLLYSHGQTTNTNTTTILGQWDFNTAALVTATVGSNLVFQSNTGSPAFTPEFQTLNIGGSTTTTVSLVIGV